MCWICIFRDGIRAVGLHIKAEEKKFSLKNCVVKLGRWFMVCNTRANRHQGLSPSVSSSIWNAMLSPPVPNSLQILQLIQKSTLPPSLHLSVPCWIQIVCANGEESTLPYFQEAVQTFLPNQALRFANDRLLGRLSPRTSLVIAAPCLNSSMDEQLLCQCFPNYPKVSCNDFVKKKNLVLHEFLLYCIIYKCVKK